MEIQQDTLIWKEAQDRKIPYPHISLFLFWRFCSFRLKIKDFKFRTVEVKLTACADDTTFLVRDVHSLKHVLKMMHELEKYSSLRANVHKFESRWIGKAKKKVSKPIKCRWISLAKTPIKILGIYFSFDKKLAGKDNFLLPYARLSITAEYLEAKMVVTCRKNSDL